MIIIYNCCIPDWLVKPVVENSTTDDSEGSGIDGMSFNDSNVVFNGVVCVL